MVPNMHMDGPNGVQNDPFLDHLGTHPIPGIMFVLFKHGIPRSRTRRSVEQIWVRSTPKRVDFRVKNRCFLHPKITRF